MEGDLAVANDAERTCILSIHVLLNQPRIVDRRLAVVDRAFAGTWPVVGQIDLTTAGEGTSCIFATAFECRTGESL